MGMGFRSTLLERQGSAVEVGLLPAFPYYRERKENKNKTSGQLKAGKKHSGATRQINESPRAAAAHTLGTCSYSRSRH